MTPPERLRESLHHSRERGRPFKVAWRVGLADATGDLAPSLRAWWRDVFSSQEQVWLCSYSRAPWPASQRGGMFIPEQRATEARGVLVLS